MSRFTGVLNLQVLVGPRAGVTKDAVGGTEATGRLSLTLLLDLLQGGVALAVDVGHEVAWADGCAHPPVHCRDDSQLLARPTVQIHVTVLA